MFVYWIDDITRNQHPPRRAAVTHELYTEGLSSAKLLPHTAIDNRTGLTSWTLTRWRYQHTSHKVALYLIYRPQKYERLSLPSWLTYSGRLNHISGHPSATGRAWDRESSPVKYRAFYQCATQPTNHVLDHFQNLIISSLVRNLPIPKFCAKSIYNYFNKPAVRDSNFDPGAPPGEPNETYASSSILVHWALAPLYEKMTSSTKPEVHSTVVRGGPSHGNM